MIHNSRRKRFRSVGKATRDAIQATDELVTEADFQKAANAQPEAAKETREVTSKTRGTKTTRADQKCGTKTTPHPTAAFTQEPATFLRKEGWNHTFPMKSLVKSTDGEGFEPTDAFRRLRFSRPVQ